MNAWPARPPQTRKTTHPAKPAAALAFAWQLTQLPWHFHSSSRSPASALFAQHAFLSPPRSVAVGVEPHPHARAHAAGGSAQC
eukprot:362910-Chlamydomonas_euryale.AAC.1